MLAIALTESRLNYYVKHKDSMTIGIGGLKKYHKTIAPINSLMALEEVWIKYLRKHKGNINKALMSYKGTVRNFKSFNKTIKIYRRLKNV